MSAAAGTRIFGVRIGVDPKILVGGLIAAALLLFWYNSRSDDETSSPTAALRKTNAPVPSVAQRYRAPVRRANANTDRSGTLRLRPVDATQGDVDPTLRLDLLTRLQFVKPEEGGRNLFETGSPPMTPEQKALIANAAKQVPKPLPPAPLPQQATGPVVNIPFKYYGFVKEGEKGAGNRGLFLDGDNVVVASEGELLKQRYLVVELRDTSARLEDVQIKQGQTLPVVPVALQ